MPPPPRRSRLIQRARGLRRRQTDAEAALWRRLRRRQFGVRFRRQHPVEPYILDFYCHELRLAVELDGNQHAAARARARDQARTAALEAQGILVLRFSNREVLQTPEAVAEALWLACQRRRTAMGIGAKPPPPPAPPTPPAPPRGRGQELRGAAGTGRRPG